MNKFTVKYKNPQRKNKKAKMKDNNYNQKGKKI
jgi:hypothetical protein